MTREEAIKVLSNYDVNGVWVDFDGKPYNAEEQAEAFDMAIEALSANTVEVVRCKDCKHHGMSNCPVWEGYITDLDMWCYFGERSDE